MMVENLGPYHGHAPLQRPSSSSPRSNEGGTPRHRIDMKCLELRQMLQSKGVRGDEVDDKVNSFRALLTRQCLDSGESKRRISAVKDSFELESPLKDLHRSGQKHRLELDARSSSRRKKKKRKRDQRKKRRRRSSTSHSESSLDRQSSAKVKPKIVSYDDDEDDEDDEDGDTVEIDDHYSDQDKKKSRRKKKSRSKTKSRSRSRGRSRQRSHEKKKKKKKAKYSDPQPEIEPRKIGRDLASSPLPKLKRIINKRRFSQETEDLSPENRFTGDESQGRQIVISSIDDIPTLDDDGKPVVKGIQSPTGSESKTVEPNAWDSPDSEPKPVSNGTSASSLLRPPTGRNLKFPKFLPKIIGTSLLNNNNNQGPAPVLLDEGVKNVEGPPKEADEDPAVESDRERKRSWSRSRSRSYSSNHSRSSSRYSHSPSRSRSRSDFRSSRSRSYSRSYSRSRTRSRTPPRSRTRSPSLPRRTGSPSFKERRRITSARKRPIPYRRKPSHWGRYSSSSDRSYDSRSRSRSRSWSRSRSRSRSPR